MKAYAKFWIALIVPVLLAGLFALKAALGDGAISPVDIVTVLIALLGALGVRQVRNTPVGEVSADPGEMYGVE